MATVCSPPHLIPRLSPRSAGAGRARLRLVGDDWAQPRPEVPRPSVHVIAPIAAATYRRRRIMSLLAIIGVTAGLQLGVLAVAQHLWASRAVPSVASSNAAAASSISGTPSVSVLPEMVPTRAVGQKVYVVRSGDSLWTIAQRFQPTGDVRPLIDELSRRAGSSSLQAGQRIDLDGLQF